VVAFRPGVALEESRPALAKACVDRPQVLAARGRERLVLRDQRGDGAAPPLGRAYRAALQGERDGEPLQRRLALLGHTTG
jgi:hypothetical protein